MRDGAVWHRRWRRPLLVGVAAALVLLAVATYASRDRAGEDPGVARAREVASSDEAFATTPAAQRALVEIAGALLAAGEDCARSAGAEHPACASRYSGAAYAEVLASGVTSCTQPGVFAHRRAIRTYLERLPARSAAPSAPRAALPPVPGC